LSRLSVLDQGSMGLQMKRLFASALVLACATATIAQSDRIASGI
jgi:hypothetical protein